MLRVPAMHWMPDRPGWRALCAAAAVVAVFGAAGTALDVAWVPGWTSVAEPAIASPAEVESVIVAAPRCPQCGWIESKRLIVSSAADPHSLEIYEYTLRMADGSSGVFQEALPASWRVGERLTVIDGISTPLN
jgi:hypothetical protein